MTPSTNQHDTAVAKWDTLRTGIVCVTFAWCVWLMATCSEKWIDAEDGRKASDTTEVKTHE